MAHPQKRKPLNNDGLDKLINFCDTSREKFVLWPLLDTALFLSQFADLTKNPYS